MKMTIFTGLKRVTETTVRGVMAEKQNSMSIKRQLKRFHPDAHSLSFGVEFLPFKDLFRNTPTAEAHMCSITRVEVFLG